MKNYVDVIGINVALAFLFQNPGGTNPVHIPIDEQFEQYDFILNATGVGKQTLYPDGLGLLGNHIKTWSQTGINYLSNPTCITRAV